MNGIQAAKIEAPIGGLTGFKVCVLRRGIGRPGKSLETVGG